MTPIVPEGNKVTYWPCDIGDRVQYRVTSGGFGTQAYEGVVVDLSRDHAKVMFSPDWVEWIEEQYLTIISSTEPKFERDSR